MLPRAVNYCQTPPCHMHSHCHTLSHATAWCHAVSYIHYRTLSFHTLIITHYLSTHTHYCTNTQSCAIIPHAITHYHTHIFARSHSALYRTLSHAVIPHAIAHYHTLSLLRQQPPRCRHRLRITAGLEARVSVTSAAFSSAKESYPTNLYVNPRHGK